MEYSLISNHYSGLETMIRPSSQSLDTGLREGREVRAERTKGLWPSKSGKQKAHQAKQLRAAQGTDTGASVYGGPNPVLQGSGSPTARSGNTGQVLVTPGRSPTYIMSPPDFDGAVLGGRVEQPIATPPETRDRLCVSCEDTLAAACSCVPHTHTAILGAAGHVAALRVPMGGDETSLKYSIGA